MTEYQKVAQAFQNKLQFELWWYIARGERFYIINEWYEKKKVATTQTLTDAALNYMPVIKSMPNLDAWLKAVGVEKGGLRKKKSKEDLYNVEPEIQTSFV